MQFLLNARFRLAAGVLWCLSWPAIAALLLTPLPFQLIARSDLLGHFLLFFVMTTAVISFARTRMQIVVLAILTIVYGAALEFGQAYVPGRHFDVADAIANGIGGVAGCVAALFLLQRLVAATSARRS